MEEKAKAEQAEREAAERDRRKEAEEAEQRRQYKQKIADLAARKDLPGLRKMFYEANGADQWDIYNALIAAGDPSIADEVAKKWITSLGGDDAAQRDQAQQALQRMGATAVPTILAQLKDHSNPDLNLALARLLQQMQKRTGAGRVSVYTLLVQHNVNGIAKLGPDARPAVLAALRSSDSQAVVDALVALRHLGGEADSPAIEPLLSASDAATRQAARTTMWHLAHSIPSRIRAAAKIAPILFTVGTLLLLSSFWWLPRLIRIIHPPFAERLGRAINKGDRQGALSAARDLVKRRGRPLPTAAVRALENAVHSGKPEMLILLAWDAERRHDSKSAVARITELWQACANPATPDWVVDEALRSNTTDDTELQIMANRLTANRKIAALLPGGVPDKPDALRKTLRDLANLGPLPVDCRIEIEKSFPARPDLAIVLLDDDLRGGRLQQAGVRAESIASQFVADRVTPAWVVGESVGVVHKWAAESREGERMRQLLTFAGRIKELLVEPETQKDIEQKLDEIRAALEAFGAPLPAGIRSMLEKRPAGSVKAAIILANDDARRGERAVGLERLFHLMNGTGEPHKAVVDAWKYEASRADFATQNQLRLRAQAGSDDAWGALALTILIAGKARPDDCQINTKVAYGAK